MKRLYYIFLLPAFLFLTGVTACGDYDMDEITGLHILTDDEMEEIRRQDSIAEALRQQINADLILEYTVTDYFATTYTTQRLDIDIAAIAECFGLTEEEVLAGINQDTGAPTINGFAIQASTHQDYTLNRSTTNGVWGHWFDNNGDAGTWNDLSALGTLSFYCEWQGFPDDEDENNYFNIGQNPNTFTTPQEWTVYECLSYEDKRVAVAITYILTERGDVTAEIANTQQLTLDMNPASTYDMVNVKFDPDQVTAALGIASMDEIEGYLGVQADGSYAQETNAGTNGFWYDADGGANAYSENSRVYTSYGGDGWPVDAIGIGQYPGTCAVGDSYTVKYGFLANNKIAMMEITVNIVAYQDPETAPEGEPEELTIDVNLQKNYTNDFANVQVDVRETLRQAFKMTTYQIHSARVSGDLKIYCQTETAEEPEYTADVPGYWLAADGSSAAYADGLCWVSLGTSETELYLYGGNHPENVSPTAGTTLTTTYIITCNGGKVTVNINFQVDPEAAE